MSPIEWVLLVFAAPSARPSGGCGGSGSGPGWIRAIPSGALSFWIAAVSVFVGELAADGSLLKTIAGWTAVVVLAGWFVLLLSLIVFRRPQAVMPPYLRR